MGYYTELHLNAQLTDNAPLELIGKLSTGELWLELAKSKLGEIPGMYSVVDEPQIPIDHIFGKSHRWSQIFNPSTTIFDIQRKTLKIRCDIKAYDNIYGHLIDWMTPFIESAVIKTKGENSDNWTILTIQ